MATKRTYRVEATVTVPEKVADKFNGEEGKGGTLLDLPGNVQYTLVPVEGSEVEETDEEEVQVAPKPKRPVNLPKSKPKKASG